METAGTTEVRAEAPTSDPVTPSGSTSKGREIRQRIAANRAKRLAIAAAMKAEAGVTEHTINKHDLGGLWFPNTTRIHSPEGRRIDHLETVAHECGHNFLHGDGIGRWLPTHVIEYEAERYAELAMRHHGMTMSYQRKNFGRSYIASYFEKDRAAGWTIDPRVQEYVSGAYWQKHHDMMRRTPPGWNHHATGFPADELYAPAIVARARMIEAVVREQEARDAAEAERQRQAEVEATKKAEAEAHKRAEGELSVHRLRRYGIPYFAAIAYGSLLFPGEIVMPAFYMTMICTFLLGRYLVDLVDKRRGRPLHDMLGTRAERMSAIRWLARSVGNAVGALSAAWARGDVHRTVWDLAGRLGGATLLAGILVWWVRVSVAGPPTPEQSALFLALLLVAVASPVATAVIDRARDHRRWHRGLPPFDPLGEEIFSRAAPSAAPRP